MFQNAYGSRQQGTGPLPLVLRPFALEQRQDHAAARRSQGTPCGSLSPWLAISTLQFSGDFDAPIALLHTCQRMNLEGIVSKRRESAYRSGPTKDWLKVKTSALRTAGVGNCSPPNGRKASIRNTPARDPVGVFYYRSAVDYSCFSLQMTVTCLSASSRVLNDIGPI